MGDASTWLHNLTFLEIGGADSDSVFQFKLADLLIPADDGRLKNELGEQYVHFLQVQPPEVGALYNCICNVIKHES